MSHVQPGACTQDPVLPQPQPAAQSHLDLPLRLRRRLLSEQALFSVYLHPSPDFQGYHRNSLFHSHALRFRVKVELLCTHCTPEGC